MDAASCDTALDAADSSAPSANPFRFQEVSPSPPAGQAPTPIGCLVFKELSRRSFGSLSARRPFHFVSPHQQRGKIIGREKKTVNPFKQFSFACSDGIQLRTVEFAQWISTL
jgi:hypothetical protein